MSRHALVIIILTLGFSTSQFGQSAALSPHATDRLLVQFESAIKAKPLSSLASNNPDFQRLNERYSVKSLSPIGDFTATGTVLIQFDSDIDIRSALTDYKRLKSTRVVEPDYIMTGSGQPGSPPIIPDDTHFNRQYGLDNDGSFSLSPSVSDADIDMPEAWEIETGSANIILAILDTGTKLDHPEFSGRIWTNDAESLNGLDTDGNFYTDDVQGWDFVNNDNDPTDDYGHGTNIAGIACANGNNNVGYAGVDWHCQLMTCKVLDNNNSGFYSWMADALYYAVDQGADVINMSIGGSGFSTVLSNAIDYAYQNNVLVVASMMNFDNDTDYYPAAFSQTLAVGSTNADDSRSTPFFWNPNSGSNYGAHIDVTAPGNFIYGLSHLSDSNYDSYWGGTSQSAPLVTGLCALLLAQDPSRSPEDLRAIIRNTTEDQVGPPSEDLLGFDIYFGHGRINAHAALSDGNSSCTEDITGNGLIDINDFIQLNSAFDSACGACPEDVTGDGLIDVNDFLQLNSHFGQNCN